MVMRRAVPMPVTYCGGIDFDVQKGYGAGSPIAEQRKGAVHTE